MNDRIRATATVHVTVEVQLVQVWSGAASFDSIYEDACKQAARLVVEAMRAAPTALRENIGSGRVIKSTPGTVQLSGAVPLPESMKSEP